MKEIHTAVIQAGGKGTRMRELTCDIIPKSMLQISGKPLLEWQIDNLKNCGITQIILIIGHLGNIIREYFQNGAKFGVEIKYVEETTPLGSAGSLYHLRNMLMQENFMLVLGDVLFNVDFDRMEKFHFTKRSEATLMVHPNAHPQDSDLVITDNDGRVSGILQKNEKRKGLYNNCVNAGIYIFSRKIFDRIKEAKWMDLEKDVLMPWIAEGKIFAYLTPEYVKDAGTPKRFYEVEKAFQKGIPLKKNLKRKQKCLFLDRDGTINRYKGLIYQLEQFELEDCAADAIRKANASEYLVIVVSNQPVIARGMCSIDELKLIHRKMVTLLGEKGAYLDDIIFCPHHPDRGYPDENVSYKVQCKCRKPSTGMIDSVAQKYHIDLSNSYIIGDTTVDIQTGINAGMKSVLVHTGKAGRDGKFSVCADIEAENLLDAVTLILDKGEKDDRLHGKNKSIY